jgi:hypothetical protein
MTDQHDDDGSPTSGGPSSSDPYAPPPPNWQPPTSPVGMPPPPAPDGGGHRSPPAQWSPQPPPYAAPPGWKPPPPPPYLGGNGGYPPPPAAGTWQPTAASGSWPPAPDAGAIPYGWAAPYPGTTNKTNGFSIASLVLAVPPVCIITVGLGSLLGLIFGIIGLRQTRRDSSRGRGMAITGIVLGALGLIVGALIVVGLVAGSSNNPQHPDNGSNDTIATMSTPAGLAPAASVLHRRT